MRLLVEANDSIVLFAMSPAMDYPIRFPGQLREHLRALRKQRGLTQMQLGCKLGVGQARIAEIEANPGLVSVDQLMRLLSTLDASLVLRDGKQIIIVEGNRKDSW